MSVEINEEKFKDAEDAMEKLEEGLLLCKFGRFNVRLLAASLTVTLAQITCVSASSFILPIAECDLDMSNEKKGFLNAAPFLGFICTVLIAGYVSNAFGRRKFLIAGSLLMGVCCIFEGSSQMYWMLILSKVFEGIGFAFCQISSTAMIAELTHKRLRDKMMIYFVGFRVLSSIINVLLAWTILTKNWYFNIWDGYFELHSWNIYYYVCSLPGLLGALQYYFLPESPKFLLVNGQSDEALEVLRNIYNENNGNPEKCFPITSLSNLPQSHLKKTVKNQLTEGLLNVKFLVRKPLVNNLILLSCLGVMCFSMSISLRMWYPQLSTIIEYYEKDHGRIDKFCTMLDSYMVSNSTSSQANSFKVCVTRLSSSVTYINTLMVNTASGLCLLVNSCLVDRIGVKYLMLSGFVISSGCTVGLHWADTSAEIAGIMAVSIAFLMVSGGLLNNMVVRIFPTTVRMLALSILMTSSRVGSLLGNIIFPLMLQKGCTLCFGVITSCCLGAAVLSLFLPNLTKEDKRTGDQ